MSGIGDSVGMADVVDDKQALSIEEGMASTVELCRARILHALEVFPFISGSMIHIALGTSTSVTLWKPILADLIARGEVCELAVRVKTPAARNQTYTLYHLPGNEYIYGGSVDVTA